MNELNNIDKNSGFKVPENYFNNFSEELEARISEEYLKKNFGNKNPFIIPENYFERFVINNKSRKGKIIKLIKPWLSAAAGIIIIFALWQFLLTGIENKTEQAQNNDTISDNIYFAENTFNFDSAAIQISEDELNTYIDETDPNSIYEYTTDENDDKEIDTDIETLYEYYIDNTDDTDYSEILAEL